MKRITDEELAELVRRTEEAAVAYICGDMDHFLELTPIAQDFTLMKPTGGPAERYDDREKEIRASADYFKFPGRAGEPPRQGDYGTPHPPTRHQRAKAEKPSPAPPPATHAQPAPAT